MRRFFVKNILFVIAVNILVKPIWVLFIDRIVQNRLPAASYGTYTALLSLSIIFQTVLDFGISSYTSRTIAQNPDKLPTLFPAMLSARLVLMVVYALLAFGWGYAIGYRGWELQLLIGVLLIQSLNSLVSFIRSNIAALHKFRTDGVLSITDRLLMIVICGFLLIYPPTARLFSIQWFVIAQIVCYFIAAVIGYTILRRLGKVQLRFSFNGPEIFRIVKQSFPYALLILQMSIYNRADVMIMERICPDGKEQAGIWAAAFRLLDQANMFGLMFATILLPMLGRMLSQKQDVSQIVKLCVNILLPLSFMVAVAGIFFSGNIMHLLYHKNALYTTRPSDYHIVFGILIASFPAWCLMYVYSTLLTANGSLKALNIIAFAGVIINLALNFYLISNYEARGGAMTSFITQTSLAIAFIICASRIIKLPVNIRWILAHAGYLLLVLALAWGITSALPTAHWLLQLSAFGGSCIGLMFVFRFVSAGSIKQLMGNRQTEA
jgi:O-antigen/teichoic acid export membrane protein